MTPLELLDDVRHRFPEDTLADAVERGAAFLDVVHPDWALPSCAAPIDLARLDMNSFGHCIIGQLNQLTARTEYVSFSTWDRTAMDYLGLGFGVDGPGDLEWIQAVVDLGFYPPIYEFVDVADWDTDAKTAWQHVIQERRAAVTP